ncbi:MAG TPA: PH domain-containing protein [Kineosporiaceae bacterium]
MTAEVGGPGDEADAGTEPVAADGRWHRVHPLTPAIRSWQVLVVLLIYLGQDLVQTTLRGDLDAAGQVAQLRGWALGGGLLIVLVVILLGGGMAGLSWRCTRYRVSHEALELQHGVVSRRQRQAPLDRLQAVDIVQPLLARLTGLARLTLEVAGGGDSRIELAYLTETQARRLRNHLLAAAAGVRYRTPEAPEAPEHFVLTVPLQRLAGALALSGGTIWLGTGAVALVSSSIATGRPGLAAGALPALLGAAGTLWNRFSTEFGFRVATSPDGLRLRHGLLQQRTQTVPPGRVQAVRLSQPLLWRPGRWWRVEVNVAGYGRERAETGVLLPVGTRDEAVAVLAFVLPDLGVRDTEHPGPVVDAGLVGTLGDGGFTAAPPAARFVDPIGWRRHGYRVTRTALLLRRGVLYRQLDVVPHARTQSVGVRQGPLQRRLALASFTLHSTPGPAMPVVAHLAAPVVARLLDEQVLRARQARAGAGPERWMETVASAAPAGHPLDQPTEPAQGAGVEELGDR